MQNCKPSARPPDFHFAFCTLHSALFDWFALTGGTAFRTMHAMLYASESVSVAFADGVATLSMRFPGGPANALDLTRLRELGRAFGAVANCPHVEVLVVRSGLPAGFCAGFDPAVLGHLETVADREVFAGEGQRIVARLAGLPCVTVAFLDGPCVGPGVALAAACDFRYAVTGPDAWFGDAPVEPCCWNVSRFAPPAGMLTAREACRAGAIDDAFSARRANVEFQLHIDRHQRRPRKRVRLATPTELADRRRAFRDGGLTPPTELPVWPTVDVGVVAGDDGCFGTAVEVALRGRRAVVLATSDAEMSLNEAATGRLFAEAVRRGRATPLDAEQATARVVHTLDGARLARLPRIVTAQPAALRFLKLSPWATVTDGTAAPVAGPKVRSRAS